MGKRGPKPGTKKRVVDRPLPVIDKVDVIESPRLKRLNTAAETAAYLGISTSTLNKGRCSGILKNAGDLPPFVQISGRIYYRGTDIEKWLESLKPRQAI